MTPNFFLSLTIDLQDRKQIRIGDRLFRWLGVGWYILVAKVEVVGGGGGHEVHWTSLNA